MTTATIGATSGGNGTSLLNVSIDTTGNDVQGKTTRFLNPMSNGFSNRMDVPEYFLASGDNTITLPTAANGVKPGFFYFQAPASNTTVTLTVRDNTQTGGATIARNGLYIRTFDTKDAGTLPTSIIIHASAVLDGCSYGFH